jgi:hypothetical protein
MRAGCKCSDATPFCRSVCIAASHILTVPRKQMENLEDRLRSLEDLIKTSVAAKMSETSLEQRVDVLTPSSLPSTTSPNDPNRFATDDISQSGPGRAMSPTLLQALKSDLPLTSTTDFPLLPDLIQDWNSMESVPAFEMSSPALASTDAELIPQVRFNGTRKCSLPPVQGGMFLLQEFLVDFNATIPVFDSSAITGMFQKCYANRASGAPIEWVAMKVVLGIAHRLRAMSPLGVRQDTENATVYLEECLEIIPELLMMRPSLLLAQCFLGIAIIVSTSPRPYPAQGFVSLAMRVIQDIHVNAPRQPGTIVSPEILQQERVFWVAFMMDADYAMRAGRLPSLSPRLINVEVPTDEDGPGEVVADGGEFKANLYRLHVDLAVLQAEYMEQVFLPRAARNSSCPEVAELRAINSRLGQWRRRWIFELDVQDLRTALHRSDLVHVVVLESMYFSSAYAFTSGIMAGSKNKTNPFSAEGLLEGMSKQKSQILYDDAKRFIDLLRAVPGDDIACNW